MSGSSQALLFAERIRQLELQGRGLLGDKASTEPSLPLLADRRPPAVAPKNWPGEVAAVPSGDDRNRWPLTAPSGSTHPRSPAGELSAGSSSSSSSDSGEALGILQTSRPICPTDGTATAIDFGGSANARFAAVLRLPTLLSGGHQASAVAAAAAALQLAEAHTSEFRRHSSSEQLLTRDAAAVLGHIVTADAPTMIGCRLWSESTLEPPPGCADNSGFNPPISCATSVSTAGVVTPHPDTNVHKQQQRIPPRSDDRGWAPEVSTSPQSREEGHTEQCISSGGQPLVTTSREDGSTSGGGTPGAGNRRRGCQKPDVAASGVARCPFAGSCESVVRRLQQTVQTQHEAARAQELALLDAGASVERLRLACTDHEQLIAAVRSVLTAAVAESFSRVDSTAAAAVNVQSVAEVSIAGLIELLKHRFAVYKDELSNSRTRARELEVQLEEYKNLQAEKHSSSAKEADERQAQLKHFYETQLRHAEQKAFDLEHELSILRSQNVSTQSTLEQKVRAHEQRVKEADARAAAAEAELQLQKRITAEKVSALKTAVDEAQRETAAIAAERNQAVQSAAALETRTANYELVAERLKEECAMARQDVLLAQQREDDAVRARAESESRLTERGAEVARLVRLIDIVRDECAQRLRGEVGLAERQERERAREELLALQRLLDASDGQLGKMAIEIDELRNERRRLRADLANCQQRCATFEVERHEASDAASQLRRQLTDAVAARDRLEAERQALADAMADCQQQAVEARPRAEQLAVRLAETELTAREAACRLESALAELERERISAQRAAASAEALQAEVCLLAQRCDSMAAAADEERRAAKTRERKLADKVAECARLNELLRHRADMMQHVEHELVERRAELADCHKEAAALRRERDTLTAVLGGLQQDGNSESGDRGSNDGSAKQLSHERRVMALHSQVKGLQQDCLAAKKLAKQTAISERAVRLECDSVRNELMSVRASAQKEEVRMRNLRHKLSALTEENRELMSDNRQLADAIVSVTAKCSALVSAVQSSQKEQVTRASEKHEAAPYDGRATQPNVPDVTHPAASDATQPASPDAVPVTCAASNACEAVRAPSKVGRQATSGRLGDRLGVVEEPGGCAAASPFTHPEKEETRAVALAPAAGDQSAASGPEPLKLAADVLTLLAEIQNVVSARGRRQQPKSEAASPPGKTDAVVSSDDRHHPLATTAGDKPLPPRDGRSRSSRLKWRSSSTPVPSSTISAEHCDLAEHDGRRGGNKFQVGINERGPSLFIEGSLQEKARLLCQELSERLTKLTGQSAFTAAAPAAQVPRVDVDDTGATKAALNFKMVGKKKRLPI